MHKACSSGHLGLIKTLLDRHADPNIENCSGESPLMRGIQFMQYEKAGEVVHSLLEYGAQLKRGPSIQAQFQKGIVANIQPWIWQ